MTATVEPRTPGDWREKLRTKGTCKCCTCQPNGSFSYAQEGKCCKRNHRRNKQKMFLYTEMALSSIKHLGNMRLHFQIFLAGIRSKIHKYIDSEKEMKEMEMNEESTDLRVCVR